MLKFIVFALLVAAIWYAFNYQRPGNWPPRDDRDDDQGGGPVLPDSRIGHDPVSQAGDDAGDLVTEDPGRGAGEHDRRD